MTMICAHRGASVALPDNSIAAFEAAIASGCEAIETDLRRAPDGRLVLAHDREQAASPDAVTLAALVELARGRIGLDLELKEPGLEGVLPAALAGWEDWLIVTSFWAGAILPLARLAPALRTGLLVDGPGDAVAAARACGADALLAEDPLVGPRLIEDAAAAGVDLWAWTVNEPERIDELLATAGVAGLITDDPVAAVGRRRLSCQASA